MIDRLESLQLNGLNRPNYNFQLMNYRLGNMDISKRRPSTVDGINLQNKKLLASGGFSQQSRMIRDKRKSLDRATLYSYQAAFIRLETSNSIEDIGNPLMRALINPDKTKMDYDDKIISIGFEHGLKTGDVFEWWNTNSYWLVYLQDLTELAYFRAEIRRCNKTIKWQNENGEEFSTMAAVRGPVETKIDYIQKHGISVDNPNHTLHILMPKNKNNVEYFQRYKKFYLQDDENFNIPPICWRVTATDYISTPGILEINAIEYYSNETEDDIENGLIGALKTKPIDPTPVEDGTVVFIVGETFIKPKKEYSYTIGGNIEGHWFVDKKYPIKLKEYKDENNFSCVKIKWDSTYSGQFDLKFGDKYTKTIVVESLF